MKKQLKIGLLFVAVSLCACTQTQLTEGETAAQTAANVLETVNTATDGGVTLLTQALVDKGLASTHNSGDVDVVNAAIAEGAAALKVQVAAKAAGVSPVAAQTMTTAVLTDPNTIALGATAATQAVRTGGTVPFTSTPVTQ